MNTSDLEPPKHWTVDLEPLEQRTVRDPDRPTRPDAWAVLLGLGYTGARLQGGPTAPPVRLLLGAAAAAPDE